MHRLCGPINVCRKSKFSNYVINPNFKSINIEMRKKILVVC